MTPATRARLQELHDRAQAELENLTLARRPWELLRDIKVELAACLAAEGELENEPQVRYCLSLAGEGEPDPRHPRPTA